MSPHITWTFGDLKGNRWDSILNVPEMFYGSGFFTAKQPPGSGINILELSQDAPNFLALECPGRGGQRCLGYVEMVRKGRTNPMPINR